MTSPRYVLLDQDGHVLIITINRPDVLNAFHNDSFIALRDAVLAAEEDPDVRAIVLTGTGRAFSAGADVKAFKEAVEQTKAAGSHHASLDQDALEGFGVAMGRLSTPIIAAVNGPAMGLGFTVSVACDIRLGTENTRMGPVFLRMGLTPEFGSTYNLVRLIGLAKACEIVFNAKVLDAQEAKDIGLLNQVLPPEQLMPAALEMAKNIASFPPVAMRWAKRNLYSGANGDLATQARLEIAANRICRVTKDHEEAVNAFLEKRPAVFQGR